MSQNDTSKETWPSRFFLPTFLFSPVYVSPCFYSPCSLLQTPRDKMTLATAESPSSAMLVVDDRTGQLQQEAVANLQRATRFRNLIRTRLGIVDEETTRQLLEKDVKEKKDGAVSALLTLT